MNQETLLTIFVAVTAVAVVLQMAILLALLLSVKRTSETFAGIAEDLQHKLEPILASAREIGTDTTPKVKEITSNLVDVSASLRLQAERLNASLNDILARVTSEVTRAQAFVNDTMDTVEKTKNKVEDTVAKPVRTVTALVEGVTTGLGVFFGRDRKEPPSAGNGIKDNTFT